MAPGGSTRGAFLPPDSRAAAGLSGQARRGFTRDLSAGSPDFPGSLAPLATDGAFRAFLRSLYRQPWVVYAKSPFGSPAHVLHYLARYTHRVAISNHRLVDVTDDTVSFRWKDYRHGSQVRTLTLDVDEFLRRFLLHVLPKRFVRIRYFGFLASRCRTRGLPQCRQAIGDAPPPPVEPPHTARPPATWPCPRCGGPMRIVERLTASSSFSTRSSRVSRMTRRDPRPCLASRRWSRPHAHPPEVCPAVDIDAHARENRHGRDVVIVLIDVGTAQQAPTFVVRTIERP